MAIDEKDFNLVKSLTAGLDHRQRQELIQAVGEIGKNDPLPRLRLLISELDNLVDAYEDRKWLPIIGNSVEQVKEFQDNYLGLHKKIGVNP